MKITKKKTVKIESKDSNVPASHFVVEKNDKHSKKTIETKPLSMSMPKKS